MRKWGVLITGFYAIVLLFLLDPITVMLVDPTKNIEWGELPWWYSEGAWILVVWAVLLIISQALLLFVAVDTSFRRIEQRRHIGVAIATVALMVGLLGGMGTWSGIVAIGGDDMLPANEDLWGFGFWILVAFFWLVWAVIFYLYKAGASNKLDWLVGWRFGLRLPAERSQ